MIASALTLAQALGCVPRERAEDKDRNISAAPAAKPDRNTQPAPQAGAVSDQAGAPETVAKAPSAPPSPSPELATSGAGAASVPGDPLITEIFRDDFNRAGEARAELGPNWRATSPRWQISDGRLCGDGVRNHPLWLARRLPKNAIVEFTATSASTEGDIKAEFWGDGQSAARGQSYTDATSYLTIFGGWQNRFHVLARIDEHAPDRREIKLVPGAADFKLSAVVPNQVYHFQVERRDGHTVRWLVDDMEILTYRDENPLTGQGHEHFGFNDWQVRVCFDDLRVTPLQD